MSIRRVWQVEYACGWNLFTMKFMGIWPEERKFDQISSYKVLIGIAFIIFFCTIPQYWLLYIDRHDFNLIMENLSLDNINGTVAFIKMIFFWSSGGQIKDLLTAMEEDWKEVSTKEDEQKMMKYATFSRKIATRATAICYVMLILHVCGQLKRLQDELVNLNIGTGREFQNKLSYIVRRHDHLNKFIDKIEDQFNIMLLFQILGCTLQLCMECFQGLMLMAGEGEEMPLIEICFFGFYIFYVLLQLYLYCYVGEKLWTESTEVARAAYQCNWYDLLPHESRSLILIIRRSREPLRLTAGKFCTLNHELYSSVLKTSMGYLSVLRATMINDE